MFTARFFFFFLSVLAALAGINAQVFRWARKAWPLSHRGQSRLKAVLVSSILVMMLGRLAGHLLPAGLAKVLLASAATVQLAVVISGILLLVVDAAGWVLRRGGAFRARFAASESKSMEAEPPSVTGDAEPPASAAAPTLPRRALLAQAAAGSAFLVGGASALYGAFKGRTDYQLVESAFKLPGLPRALDGFTIAQLSDVHIGVYVGEPELRIAEDLLRRARPDLIVLTGDLLDSDARLADELGRFVRRLSSLARGGAVAILGNHDYYAGADDVAAAVTAAGARLLRNQGIVLGDARAGIALLGVDDVYAARIGGGPDWDRTLRSLRSTDPIGLASADMPRVLLCHNPSFFAESAGRVGLQLSGHTHGGQVNLGVTPAEWLLPGGWVAGRYDSKGSALYVNRGFGTVGPPARLGAPPEVTRIVLTS
jgi:predicted MPP superfamily phosphohydrolase